MPLELFYVDAAGAVIPFGSGITPEEPPDPPDPPFDAYIDGVNVAEHLFGVTAAGQPYHDNVSVPIADRATFTVDAAGVPYLTDAR